MTNVENNSKSEIEISIGKRKFNLICKKQDYAKIMEYSSKIDNAFNKIKNSNHNASFDDIMIMITLNLQAQIDKNEKDTVEEIIEKQKEEYSSSLNEIYNSLEKIINQTNR